MIRLLHLADLHLGASFTAFGDLADTRRTAVLDAFRRLPEITVAESVDAVLIAGDLFDSPQPAPDVAAAARDTLRRVGVTGVRVFVVPGNHDSITLRPNPYTDPLGDAHVFAAPCFEAPISVDTANGTLHVYGIAYDRAREADPLATFRRAGQPGVHVVLIHGSVPDAPHWIMSQSSLRLPMERLANLEADYIALGDYHRFRPPREFDASGTSPACYSGSFAALDLTETGPRGYVVAEVRPDGSPRVRHCSSEVPPVEDLGEFDVSPYESEVDVADAVARRASEGTIPVVCLTGTPGFPLDIDVVCTELQERFQHAHVIDKSSYYASDSLEELARQDTVVGHVVRIGRHRIEEAEDEAQWLAAEGALRVALNALVVR